MTERAGPTPVAVAPGAGRPIVIPSRGHGTVKLGSSASGGSLSVIELVLEPGEGPGVHVHSREHELWYVLEGEFRFLLGDDLVHEPAGGLAFGPRGTPHAFQNAGPGAGRLLVITTPSGLEGFFLEYERQAAGPHDVHALEAAARVGGIEFVGPPLRETAPSSTPQPLRASGR